VIAPQSVFADFDCADQEIRDRDPGVVAALAADQLRTSQRINTLQSRRNG
jgi:hypothetical protein